MSNDNKKQESSVDRTQTQAYRAGFLNGYTNDNPSSDASVSGFYAGYVGTRPEPQEAPKGEEQ
jgi:hypothetical protein